MTTRLYLHVGSPKSGTTYVQQVLETNREPLAAAGVLVVGERHLDRIHAAMVVRDDPRIGDLPERRRESWDRLVDQVRGWSGERAVLSYELFSAASREQAERALDDLARIPGLEVHVVVTSRDLGLAVPSAWQERLKFGLTEQLGAWTPPPASQRRSEWGWRTMDPAGVARRWGATLPPERVHVVTVPRSGSAPRVLWDRFAQACDLADVPLDLDVPRSNESLGVVEAELLRRVNERLPEPLSSSSREQAVWLRDTLAHGVLAPLGDERIAPPPELVAAAAEVADRACAEIQEAGYAVHGDLDDLRATAGPGRRPDEVDDAELVDPAVDAVIALLLRLRDRAATTPTDAEEPASSAVRRVVRRVVGRRVESREQALQERIAALEGEVAAARRLHLRVASLQDVVTELLLTPQLRDDTVTLRALSRYQREAL